MLKQIWKSLIDKFPKHKRLSIEQHKKRGHILVGNWGLTVGEKYFFNYAEFEIVEVCDGDLAGHCWIRKIKNDYRMVS